MFRPRPRWCRPSGWTVSILLLSCATLAADDSGELVLAPGAPIAVTVGSGLAAEAAWNGGVLAPAESLRAPTTGGDYWLVLLSRSSTGVPSAPRWLRVRVDGEPPTLTFATEPEPYSDERGRWLPPAATARLAAHDAVAGVRSVSLTAAAVTSANSPDTAQAVLTLPAENQTLTLTGAAVDRVGNRAVLEPWAVHIDATPPTVLIELEGPHLERDAGAVVTPETGVVPRADDTGSGVGSVSVSLDGKAIPELLPGGPHTVSVSATDRVGNRAQTELLLVVDDAGPSITWGLVGEPLVERPNGAWTNRPIGLTLEAHDAPAGLARLEVSAGGIRTPFDPGLRFERPPVRVIATDALGNESTTDIAWQLDTEPPVLTLVPAAGTAHAPGAEVAVPPGTPLRVAAEDAGCGVATIETAYRQRYWYRDVRYRPRDTLVFSRPGTFFVRARSEDHLGNVAEGSWRVRVAAAEGQR